MIKRMKLKAQNQKRVKNNCQKKIVVIMIRHFRKNPRILIIVLLYHPRILSPLYYMHLLINKLNSLRFINR